RSISGRPFDGSARGRALMRVRGSRREQRGSSSTGGTMSKSTKWILVGIGLLALSAMTVGVILVVALGGGRVPGNAVLVVRASGEFPDYDNRSPLAQALSGEIDTLSETTDSIDRAGADGRIRGIELIVEGLDSGWGKTQELRAAL